MMSSSPDKVAFVENKVVNVELTLPVCVHGFYFPSLAVISIIYFPSSILVARDVKGSIKISRLFNLSDFMIIPKRFIK